MNIGIIAEWAELDVIRYLFMATIVLGLMNCIKYLVIRK